MPSPSGTAPCASRAARQSAAVPPPGHALPPSAASEATPHGAATSTGGFHGDSAIFKSFHAVPKGTAQRPPGSFPAKRPAAASPSRNTAANRRAQGALCRALARPCGTGRKNPSACNFPLVRSMCRDAANSADASGKVRSTSRGERSDAAQRDNRHRRSPQRFRDFQILPCRPHRDGPARGARKKRPPEEAALLPLRAVLCRSLLRTAGLLHTAEKTRSRARRCARHASPAAHA